MNFVDDVNLVRRSTGPDSRVGSQLADFVDAAVAGTVDFKHVDIFALGDRFAGLAFFTGLRCRSGFAIQALGKNPRRRRFANSTSTCKQISVADTILPDRIAQRGGDMVLPNQ